MYSIFLEDIPFLGDVDLKVFVDGELVDTLMVTSEPEEGQKLESEAISAALEGREVTNVSFVGTMIMVSTEPAVAERESQNE